MIFKGTIRRSSQTMEIEMFGLFVDVFGGWQTRHVANKASKVTFNELSKLSDYELSDIGLARGDIRDVAKAYYDEVVQERKVSFSAPLNPNLVGAV